MTIKPSRLLQITTTLVYDNDYWFDAVNPSMWDGTPYRWNVIGIINVQIHSSDQTRTPFSYNGQDVAIGDWFTDSSGRAFKIIEISDNSDGNFTCVIEDVDRFNVYNDTTISGYGGPTSPVCFIFPLSENGLPNLGQLPSGYLSAEALAALESRFISRNYQNDFIRVYQTNNGFSVGDFIKIDEEAEGRYELCPSSEINLAIGVVNGINVPGTDWFTFKALNEIVEDVQPPLVGEYGDIFYMDPANPGKVTGIKPAINARPVYIRLETENRAVRLNAITDSNTETHVLKISGHVDNQVEFQMPSTAADVTLMSINGIENTNFTFDAVTKMVTFDPVATGYIVEASDEVIFTYVTFN